MPNVCNPGSEAPEHLNLSRTCPEQVSCGGSPACTDFGQSPKVESRVPFGLHTGDVGPTSCAAL